MSDLDVSSVANQALDAIGWPEVLGDLQDGSHHAQIMLRAYRNCLQQLLRAANWNFARKSAPLLLLADSSGNTPLVGTVVPNPNFIYEYAYPVDCVKARFVPWNLKNQADTAPPGNIAIPQTPLVTGLGNFPAMVGRIQPARFLVASDFNYLPQTNPISWETQGISPQSRTVILTNVREAVLVYTALMLYPSIWDSLFRAALVAYLASEVALPIWSKTDKKFGLEVRNAQAEIVRAKVTEARLVDGNESLSTSDIRVDWMDARRSGGVGGANGWGGAGWGGGGDGVFGYGYDQLSLANGAVF